MAGQTLQLIEPDLGWEAEYRQFNQEYLDAGEPDAHGSGLSLDGGFAALIQKLLDGARGLGLSEGWVPQTTYWLVQGRRILGCSELRHRLTPDLLEYDGNIGYSVRPSERRKGYATVMLTLTLTKARSMGLKRVLVTCPKSNVASARVIQKNGGVLESEGLTKEGDQINQRYWIELV